MYSHRNDRRVVNIMSQFTALFVVAICLLVSESNGLPTRDQPSRHSSGSAESLSNILRDLENAVFRLKEYALRVDYENRKTSPTDADFEDPSTELSENSQRHLSFDIYPELVPEMQDKKSTEDVQVPAVKDKTSSEVEQKPVATQNSKGVAPSANSSKTSDVDHQVDDISLKEALEYLVNLAKLKKQEKTEKRDFDIPFPISGQ